MTVTQTRLALVILALVLVIGSLFIGYRATADSSPKACYISGMKYDPCP